MVRGSAVAAWFGAFECIDRLARQLHPVTAVRGIPHRIQAARTAPDRHRRAIDAEQRRHGGRRVAAIPALPHAWPQRLTGARRGNAPTIADAVDLVLREQRPAAGPPALSIEDRGDLLITMVGRQGPDPLHDPRIGAVLVTGSLGARDGLLGDHVTLPANPDVDRLRGQGEGHIAD